MSSLFKQPAQHQLLVGDAGTAELAAHVGERRLRTRLRHDLARARPVEDAATHLLVHGGHGFLAELAERVADDLIGHLLVALAEDDVDRRLAADELRQRRHHDRMAELDAHAAGLLQRLLQLRFLADLAQLMAEIGDHAARHLMLVGGEVVFGRHADRKALALGDDREVIGDRPQHLLVDHRLVADGAQIVRHVEDRGQRGAVGERRNAGIDDPDAEPDRLERHQRPEPGGAMAVQLDRDAAAVPQDDRNERADALGRQQAAGILEARAGTAGATRPAGNARHNIRRCERGETE